MATNADIRKGDTLVTSGLDGIYPPGLAVAQVSQIETKSTDAFARIVCQPAAGIDRNRQLLILLTDGTPPPHPLTEETRDRKPGKRPSLALSESGKETKDAKETNKEAAAAPAKPGATTTTATQATKTSTSQNLTTTTAAGTGRGAQRPVATVNGTAVRTPPAPRTPPSPDEARTPGSPQ
jgi:rod shape-determining protein MreC